MADDGPDHDCAVTNGSGRVMGVDISDLAVTCTSLIPHGIVISTAVPFTFDPRVTRYDLPVSVLQQEVAVTVTGATLTAVTVAGQPATPGQASGPVPLVQGQATVAVELTKGALSRRYELIFARGGQLVVEASYTRAINAGAGDRFGLAMSTSADYVAIGASGEDSSSEIGNDEAMVNTGAVYVYRRTGQTWTFSQILKGTSITADRRFGGAVAMAGDLLVVGSHLDDARVSNGGAAYVFRLDRANGRWLEEQRLTASDAAPSDAFGASVAVDGDLIVVGASHKDSPGAPGDNVGAVYTFRRNGAVWIEESKLGPPTPAAQTAFGWLVALDGDALAVQQDSGSRLVHVYRRSGTSWNQEAVPLIAAGPAIALEDDVLAVGQPGHSPGGAVRVFTRSGASWSETGLLKAANPAAGAEIGYGVAIRDNVVVTAASATRRVQIFDKVGGTWIPVPPLAPSGPAADDPSVPTFGTAVAVSGNGAVVGASGDGGPGNTLPGSGTVWMFR